MQPLTKQVENITKIQAEISSLLPTLPAMIGNHALVRNLNSLNIATTRALETIANNIEAIKEEVLK